jgi:hemerythrin
LYRRLESEGLGEMDAINWSPEYSVGVGILDEQHKNIILAFNRLVKAEAPQTNSMVISDLLTQMTKYAQEHFKTEEALLVEHGYPLFDQHKGSHTEYRKKLVNLCMAVSLNVPQVPQVMLKFLSQWWQYHILVEDMQYKPFLLGWERDHLSKNASR